MNKKIKIIGSIILSASILVNSEYCVNAMNIKQDNVYEQYNINDEDKQKISSLLGELDYTVDYAVKGVYYDYSDEYFKDGIPQTDEAKYNMLYNLIYENNYALKDIWKEYSNSDGTLGDIPLDDINQILEEAIGQKICDFKDGQKYKLNTSELVKSERKYVRMTGSNRGEDQPNVIIDSIEKNKDGLVVIKGKVQHIIGTDEVEDVNEFTAEAEMNSESRFGGITIKKYDITKSNNKEINNMVIEHAENNNQDKIPNTDNKIDTEYEFNDEDKQKISSLLGELDYTVDYAVKGVYYDYSDEYFKDGIPQTDEAKYNMLYNLIYENNYALKDIWKEYSNSDGTLGDIPLDDINQILEEAIGQKICDFKDGQKYKLNTSELVKSERKYVRMTGSNRGEDQPNVIIDSIGKNKDGLVIIKGKVQHIVGTDEVEDVNEFTAEAEMNSESRFGGITIKKYDITKSNNKEINNMVIEHAENNNQDKIPNADNKIDEGQIPNADNKIDEGQIPNTDNKIDEGQIPNTDNKTSDMVIDNNSSNSADRSPIKLLLVCLFSSIGVLKLNKRKDIYK